MFYQYDYNLYFSMHIKFKVNQLEFKIYKF